MSVELTPEQITELRQLEDLHTTIRNEIERAKTAGLDVSELEARYEAVEKLRVGILKVYGGPQPKRRAVG